MAPYVVGSAEGRAVRAQLSANTPSTPLRCMWIRQVSCFFLSGGITGIVTSALLCYVRTQVSGAVPPHLIVVMSLINRKQPGGWPMQRRSWRTFSSLWKAEEAYPGDPELEAALGKNDGRPWTGPSCSPFAR